MKMTPLKATVAAILYMVITMVFAGGSISMHIFSGISIQSLIVTAVALAMLALAVPLYKLYYNYVLRHVLS